MARPAFLIFKWTVYALLALNSYLYFRTKLTLTPFIDQMAWIGLLGTMEYESSTLDQPYTGRWERRLVLGITAFCYAVIVYAWYGYIVEREWLDVVNSSAWLLVCAILFWQIYSPGDYEGREYATIKWAKIGLYAVLVGCALFWTVEASKPLDTVDAWLWILCFAVIESNVFGFDQREDAKAEAGQDQTTV